jgi:hypothetical protein
MDSWSWKLESLRYQMHWSSWKWSSFYWLYKVNIFKINKKIIDSTFDENDPGYLLVSGSRDNLV